MGLHKKIQSPDKLIEYFAQYEEWVESNPMLVQDYVGKDADEVLRKKQRPKTMEGFENFLFKKGIIATLAQYFSNRDERFNDFKEVCEVIKRCIRQDQIEGGMVKIYDANITARLNGLTDKSEVTKMGTTVIIQELPVNPINEPINS